MKTTINYESDEKSGSCDITGSEYSIVKALSAIVDAVAGIVKISREKLLMSLLKQGSLTDMFIMEVESEDERD